MRSTTLTFVNGVAPLDNTPTNAHAGWLEIVCAHSSAAGVPTVTLQRSFDGVNYESLQTEGWVLASQTAGTQRHIFHTGDYPRTINGVTMLGLTITPYLQVTVSDTAPNTAITATFYTDDHRYGGV